MSTVYFYASTSDHVAILSGQIFQLLLWFLTGRTHGKTFSELLLKWTELRNDYNTAIIFFFFNCKIELKMINLRGTEMINLITDYYLSMGDVPPDKGSNLTHKVIYYICYYIDYNLSLDSNKNLQVKSRCFYSHFKEKSFPSQKKKHKWPHFLNKHFYSIYYRLVRA